MRLGRSRRSGEQEPASAAPTPAGPRARGPWDASEKDVSDDPDYLDFGSLLVRGRPGMKFQLPPDDEEGSIGSIVVVAEESGLELRAFAAARSGGVWDEVRADLEAEVRRLDGEATEAEGPFGTELHIRVPVTVGGEEGFQPSRAIGIEGPRWLLRAMFLGREALEPSDDGPMMDVLRDVVVVRGDEPRASREPLLLTINAELEVAESPAQEPRPDLH